MKKGSMDFMSNMWQKVKGAFGRDEPIPEPVKKLKHVRKGRMTRIEKDTAMFKLNLDLSPQKESLMELYALDPSRFMRLCEDLGIKR